MNALLQVASAGWPALVLFGAAGWGQLLRPAWPKGAPLRDDLYASACAGILVVSLGAILANFWTGLGRDPGLVVVGAGLVPFLVRLGRSATWRAQCVFLLVVVVLTAWWLDGVRLLLFGRSMSLSYDAGLYHVPQMSWVASAPVVQGLANLEGRLGFNSSWLSFVSALRVDAWFGWRHVLHAEIAIRALAAGWLGWRLLRELSTGWTPRARLYAAALAVLVLCHGFMGFQSSLDNPANLCALLAWVAYAESCVAADPTSEASRASLASVLVLALLAISMRLSLLPLAVLPMHALWLRARHGRGPALAEMTGMLAVSCLFLGAWLSRGIVTSGCLLYPASASCFESAWTVPADRVLLMSAKITGWARQPDATFLSHAPLADLSWLRDWTGPFLRSGPALLLGFAAIAWLAARFAMARTGSRAPVAAPDSLGTRAVAMTGLAFWLVLAPDPRFSWGFFAIAAAALIRGAMAATSVPANLLERARRVLPETARSQALALAVACAVLAPLRWPPLIPPTPEAIPARTHNGAMVRRPRVGIQCWTLIPCSPYPVDGIDAWHELDRWRFAPTRAGD